MISLTSMLTSSGVRVSRYEGQTPGADDMLITDVEPEQAWAGRGVVMFCRRHIGIPLERSPRGMGAQRGDTARAVGLAGAHLQRAA